MLREGTHTEPSWLCRVAVMLAACAPGWFVTTRGADWPAYRGDARRSAYTAEEITGSMKLAWSIKLPHAPTPAWSRNGRIRYDVVFGTVVAGQHLYVGDHVEGVLRALDLKTGEQKWAFQTGGPIRCAPTVWKDTVIVASDDGFVYALDARDGSRRWSIRPGPSEDLVLGNGYMISRWPVRGAPTVEGDTVYAGAGVWPSDGFHLVALDAGTGKIKWRNDDSGSLMLTQPHGAKSKSGLAAQGYLTVTDSDLLIPPGRALPAVFDKGTGRFKRIGRQGKTGGGVAMAHEDLFTCAGQLYRVDKDKPITGYLPIERVSEWPLIEALPHDAMTPTGIVAARGTVVRGFGWTSKDGNPGLRKTWEAKASAAVTDLIVAGQQVVLGLDSRIEMIDRKTRGTTPVADELDGEIGALLYANGHLVASTTSGHLYCFSRDGRGAGAPRRSIERIVPVIDADSLRRAKSIVQAADVDKGYAVDLGCGDGSLCMALTQVSDLKVIAVEPDAELFAKARARFLAAGLYGSRVMIFNRPLDATGLPGTVANLIVSSRAALDGKVLAEAKRIQRPYGGAICSLDGERVVVERSAAVAGGGRWTHQYADPANTMCSDDAALSGQLNMLWYRDYDLPSASRWLRAPAPLSDHGILYHACPNGIIAVDAYNGTEIWRFDAEDLLSVEAGFNTYHAGGIFCLGDGMLFIRRKDRCLCLDAKTGELLREIALPDPEAHDLWGYLAYSDGVVYGTAASTDHGVKPAWPRTRRKAVFEGKTFFATDARTGRLLWRFEPKHHIGNRAVAIDDRNVYVVDRVGLWKDYLARRQVKAAPGALVALDKKTGARRWSADTGELGTGVMASTPTRRVCVWHLNRLRTFDADTGERLYEIQSDHKVNIYVTKAPAMIGDTIYWERHAFDLRSGKKKAFDFRRSYGCGSVSASRNMLFFRSGTIGYVDLNAERNTRDRIGIADIQNFGGIRPGCYVSIISAGGLVLVPDNSASCTCSYFNQCWIALQPARSR